MNDDLWYAQVCVSCLSEVAYCSWHKHVRGQVHQSNFSKCPRAVTLKRSIPPGNEGSTVIPTLFDKKYFTQISNYVTGSKILVLGEQDFSYSLGMNPCGDLKLIMFLIECILEIEFDSMITALSFETFSNLLFSSKIYF